MKLTRLTFTVLLITLLHFSAVSFADEFGTGGDQFTIAFIGIGYRGNLDDTTGDPNPAGMVGDPYSIGRHEVSRDMVTKANNLGTLGITLADMTGMGGNGPNRPASGVSWNEAARFVNWLNTSEGFNVAYKFSIQPGNIGYNANDNLELWQSGDPGFDAANPFRNSLARYVLPSIDEWYKAAYYDPTANSGSGGYWNYPTGSDTAPTAVTGGTTAGTAVYDQDLAQGPADIMNAGGLSPNGVMGMGGNVFEWQETESDLVNDNGSSSRVLRGGDWNTIALPLISSVRFADLPTLEVDVIGFRVVRLAELGDANDDGALNNLDITAFAEALFMPTAYAVAYPDVDPDLVLDMNNDGAFNNLDISGFATALGF